MLCALNFLKGVVHMFIHGFPMFQIFNMRPPILIYWKHTECTVARDWKWTWLWTSQKLPDLIQEHDGNITQMNAVFLMDTILEIRELLQNYLRLEKMLMGKMKLQCVERLCS